jgi:hypothetical protein
MSGVLQRATIGALAEEVSLVRTPVDGTKWN